MGAYRHSTRIAESENALLRPTGFVDDRTALADSVVLMASFRSPRPDPVETAGGPPTGSAQPAAGRGRDLLVRLAGLLAVGCSAGALFWLHRLLHLVPQPRPTLGQYLLALLGFVGASIGSALLALGRHIHDRIELSDRWRPRL